MSKTIVFYGIQTATRVDREILAAKLYESFLKRATRELRYQIGSRDEYMKSIRLEVRDDARGKGSFLFFSDTLRELEPGEAFPLEICPIGKRMNEAAINQVILHLPGDTRIIPPTVFVVASDDAPAGAKPVPDHLRAVIDGLSMRQHAMIAMIRVGSSVNGAIGAICGDITSIEAEMSRSKLAFLQAERLKPLPPEAFIPG